MQNRRYSLGIGHDHALGNLKHQPLGLGARELDQFSDMSGETLLAQRAHRHVHRDGQRQAGRPPAATISERGLDHAPR